jgi:hypothetical protein
MNNLLDELQDISNQIDKYVEVYGRDILEFTPTEMADMERRVAEIINNLPEKAKEAAQKGERKFVVMILKQGSGKHYDLPFFYDYIPDEKLHMALGAYAKMVYVKVQQEYGIVPKFEPIYNGAAGENFKMYIEWPKTKKNKDNDPRITSP